MVSNKNLEIELQELFKQKRYSEIVFEITSKTNENERSAGLFNLLGISRITDNRKDKNIVSLAVEDFKKGYLLEKESIIGIDSLSNFVISSVLLRDLGNSNVDFDEIISFYKSSEKICLNHRGINVAMTMVYRRLNDYEGVLFHYERLIKNKNFGIRDLCSYGYWRCFDKNWKQSNFFDYGKFLDNNLPEYNERELVPLSKEKNNKIKIGFLSSDIKGGHSIIYFLKTILSNYDKNKFEIFLFLHQTQEDQTTKEFIKLVDKSINISSFSDIQAINDIREQNIDIMIDLMGYTSTNRIELFKNRIAKNQILWMGYCNTSGLKNMDYIISDRNLIYPEEEKFYAEKVIFLNSIWNCHCGLDTKREYYDPPLNKNRYITFGSFNNFDKITPDVIDVWSKILRSLKNSKLILKSAKEIHTNKRIKKLFEKNGIQDSVIFLDRKDEKEDHLNAYKEIDIALDTFPYNGVTTSFESIWMGVPVITLSGYNFNSRCGESINKNLNIEYLIAKNENEYVAKAVDLSNNPNKYLELRKEIFEKALKSPLFDGKNYSKNFFQSLEDLNN